MNQSLKSARTFCSRFALAPHLGVLGVVAAAALAGGKLHAADQAPVTSETPSADLKELSDPTVLKSRMWLETEWNKFEDGRSVVEETLGTLWAWRVSANQDFAVRLKLPVKFRFGSDDPTVSDIGGLGDIKIAAGTAVRLSDIWRIGGGLDLQMPSGRHDLSDNVWRVQEFLAMGVDITPWLTFSPSAEYNQSFAEEGGASSQHYLETYVPFTFLLPRKWAITLAYENKTDFENGSRFTNRAKIGVAKELENVPLSFALSAKREFDGSDKEFQVNFVVSYYFR